MNIFNNVKKAEIHVHLEATITPSICKKFADRNNHEIPDELFGAKYAYEWDDFYDFLKKYDMVTSVIHFLLLFMLVNGMGQKIFVMQLIYFIQLD